MARGRVAAALLVAGSLAATFAVACATGAESDSAYDGGDDGSGGDGTLSEGGPNPEGGQADHAVDVATCTPSGPPTTCSSPTSLGSMMPAQTVTSTGNLVPLGQDAYLTVTFTGNTSEDYHPNITLTKGASEFLFDVFSDCSGTALPCGDQEDDDTEAGTSIGLTTWEVEYTGGDFNSEAAPGTDGAFEPIPAVGNGGTVLVHLYRKDGLPVSCNEYTLTVGN
jgi:hypothetical protein